MNTNAKNQAVATPSDKDIAFASDVIAKLETISAVRLSWEEVEFKTANQRLYQILSNCQRIYVEQFLEVKDENSRRHLRAEIEQRLKAEGIGMQSRTETLTLFVKMVFKSDRQRTHSYAYAIKAAIAEGVNYKDLSSFIESKGGIEEIRLEKPLSDKAKARQQKREEAINHVKQEIELAKLNPLATVHCNIDPSTRKVLLAGVVNANGSIDVTSVLQDVPESMEMQVITQLAIEHLARKEKQEQQNLEAERNRAQVIAQAQVASNAEIPIAA